MLTNVDSLVDRLRDGMRIAVPVDYSRRCDGIYPAHDRTRPA